MFICYSNYLVQGVYEQSVLRPNYYYKIATTPQGRSLLKTQGGKYFWWNSKDVFPA